MLDGIRQKLREMVQPPKPKPPEPPKPAAPPAAQQVQHAAQPHGPNGAGPAAPPPAAESTDSGVTKGLSEAANGTVDGFSVRQGIDQLNSKGDSAFIRISPEAKLQGSLRAFKVGGKGQLGTNIQVTRDSDAPDTTYTVRYDKQSLAAATGETGTDTLKGGKAGGGKKPGANVKAELGVQGFDVVEMRFANKEDAIRATETLHKLQRADMLDDAMDFAVPGASTVSGSGPNPLANPLNKDGAPGAVSNKVAGVDPAELDFLRKNVSAYETTIGGRGRLALEVKGDLKLIDGALEGRIDGTERITRRVELPTADKDGAVTYSVSGALRLSAKERANRKLKGIANGMFTAKTDNRLELANARTTVSLNYTLPKGTDPSTSGGGRPVPEKDALSGSDSGNGNGTMQFKSVSLENRMEWLDQSPTDVSRLDSKVITETLDIGNPSKVGDAAGRLFTGQFDDAARAADAKVTLDQKTINKSGVDIQPGVKIDLGIGDLEATAILAAGVDDIVDQRSITFDPNAATKPPVQVQAQPENQPQPPKGPTDDGKTWSVQPFDGVTMRNEPEGERAATIQSGTFLREAGDERTTGDGHTWMKMSGTDVNDRKVEGWVRADLLSKHSAATGAMDEAGRINPTAEHNRMDQIKVEQDDNLWNLAAKHGWSYEETVAANKDHIVNPALVFKGDTVYVPGSARGPKPVPAEKPPAPQKAPDQPESGSSSSSSPSSSSSATDPKAQAEAKPEAKAEAKPDAEATPETKAAPPAGDERDVPGRPSLDDVMQRYQVSADTETRDWKPKMLEGLTGGLISLGSKVVDSAAGTSTQDMLKQLSRSKMPASEANALDKLGDKDQLEWAKLTKETDDQSKGAFEKPAGFAGDDTRWANDGHVDAYRHALWNARMTKKFGADWTREYATAHEKVGGNPGPREAMDLHNNEVGRRIAEANPNASDDDLKRLVREAVDRGDTVVIDKSNRLAWSDRVALGDHGFVPPGTAELPGHPGQVVPGADPSTS